MNIRIYTEKHPQKVPKLKLDHEDYRTIHFVFVDLMIMKRNYIESTRK